MTVFLLSALITPIREIAHWRPGWYIQIRHTTNQIYLKINIACGDFFSLPLLLLLQRQLPRERERKDRNEEKVLKQKLKSVLHQIVARRGKGFFFLKLEVLNICFIRGDITSPPTSSSDTIAPPLVSNLILSVCHQLSVLKSCFLSIFFFFLLFFLYIFFYSSCISVIFVLCRNSFYFPVVPLDVNLINRGEWKPISNCSKVDKNWSKLALTENNRLVYRHCIIINLASLLYLSELQRNYGSTWTFFFYKNRV